MTSLSVYASDVTVALCQRGFNDFLVSPGRHGRAAAVGEQRLLGVGQGVPSGPRASANFRCDESHPGAGRVPLRDQVSVVT